jgi:hypothetical protein
MATEIFRGWETVVCRRLFSGHFIPPEYSFGTSLPASEKAIFAPLDGPRHKPRGAYPLLPGCKSG